MKNTTANQMDYNDLIDLICEISIFEFYIVVVSCQWLLMIFMVVKRDITLGNDRFVIVSGNSIVGFNFKFIHEILLFYSIVHNYTVSYSR